MGMFSCFWRMVRWMGHTTDVHDEVCEFSGACVGGTVFLDVRHTCLILFRYLLLQPHSVNS